MKTPEEAFKKLLGELEAKDAVVSSTAVAERIRNALEDVEAQDDWFEMLVDLINAVDNGDVFDLTEVRHALRTANASVSHGLRRVV